CTNLVQICTMVGADLHHSSCHHPHDRRLHRLAVGTAPGLGRLFLACAIEGRFRRSYRQHVRREDRRVTWWSIAAADLCSLEVFSVWSRARWQRAGFPCLVGCRASSATAQAARHCLSGTNGIHRAKLLTCRGACPLPGTSNPGDPGYSHCSLSWHPLRHL